MAAVVANWYVTMVTRIQLVPRLTVSLPTCALDVEKIHFAEIVTGKHNRNKASEECSGALVDNGSLNRVALIESVIFSEGAEQCYRVKLVLELISNALGLGPTSTVHHRETSVVV